MTNLSFGPRLLAMPGPTNVPAEVLQAMHRPAMDIYGGELEQVTDSLLADLKTLFRSPGGQPFLYIANGHGGWEAAISNMFSRGDRILVLESGRFAVGWGETAAKMGVEVEILKGPERGAVDPQAIEDRLKDDGGAGGAPFKALLVAQIDTATGCWSDVLAIREAMNAAGHEAMLLVDGVASIGCTPFEMERWGVDFAMTGSQKGLMTPPGLAAMVAGPRAWEARLTADLRTHYWDWDFRQGPVHYHKYCGTPPVHMIFGLRRALDMLLKEEGLEAAWARHRALADATLTAAGVWAEAGAVEFNILRPEDRSPTVTALRVREGYAGPALRKRAQDLCGVTLGTPIGGYEGPGGGFRIAHMGHASAVSMLGMLGATETAMRSLDWPVGDNALGAAAAVLGDFISAG